MAFYKREPWGEDREDLRFASVVQVLMNVNRNSQKHPGAFTLQEASLTGGDQFEIETKAGTEQGRPATEVKPRQDWQQMKMIAMMALAPPQKRKEP